MLFRRKSHLLYLCMLRRSKRRLSLLKTLLPWSRFGGRKRKFVHDINRPIYTETEIRTSHKFIQGIAGLRASICKGMRSKIAKIEESQLLFWF